MTDSQIKALFAKQHDQAKNHNTLRLSVQGMKTQQGYMRGDIRKIEGRVIPLETQLHPLPKRIDKLQFCVLTIAVSVALFYGTLILGWIMR